MQLDIQCEVDRRHRGSAADKDVTRLSSLVVFGAELGANESWVRITSSWEHAPTGNAELTCFSKYSWCTSNDLIAPGAHRDRASLPQQHLTQQTVLLCTVMAESGLPGPVRNLSGCLCDSNDCDVWRSEDKEKRCVAMAMKDRDSGSLIPQMPWL